MTQMIKSNDCTGDTQSNWEEAIARDIDGYTYKDNRERQQRERESERERERERKRARRHVSSLNAIMDINVSQILMSYELKLL